MVKKIVLILLAVIILGIIGGAVYLSLGEETQTYSLPDTVNNILEMVKGDKPVYVTSKLSLSEGINKGIAVEYRIVGAVGKDDGKINLYVSRNGMETKYSNILMKQNGVTYLGMDSFLSLLEDEGIEFAISDSEFVAQKYMELPEVTEELKSNFETFKEQYLSARTKTIAEMDEKKRTGSTFVFSGYEYLDVLKEEQESKKRFGDTVYNSFMSTLSPELKTAIENQQKKTTVDVFYRINHTAFSLLDVFSSNIVENESISIVEKVAGSENSASYEVSVKNYEAVTASFAVSVSPLTQTVDLTVPASRIVTSNNWMEQLANEIDDSINDNYETSDAWDTFTLGVTNLVLIKYDVDADIACTFDFNLLGLSQMTVTIQTRDVSIHEALADYYKSTSGWMVRRDEAPDEEKNGIFECYTKEESLFPDGFKRATTPAALYDMLEDKYH